MSEKKLRAPDLALLRKLDDEGPLVLPERTAHRLWLRELIDSHGPARYRISGKGREVLRSSPTVSSDGGGSHG